MTDIRTTPYKLKFSVFPIQSQLAPYRPQVGVQFAEPEILPAV